MDGLPDMSSDEEDAYADRDLEHTVYWGELNKPLDGAHAGGKPSAMAGSTATADNRAGAANGISPAQSPKSPSRRVSFAEDVWVQEIPRIEESSIKDLFYSEADIDDMYQEAEDEVTSQQLSATVPLTTPAGGDGSSLSSTM